MYIEEEIVNFSNYQPSLIEQQLIESILDSFYNHATANASFLAERLVCEHDLEEYRSLLAECYMKENKPYKVLQLLKDCKTEYPRYQLALANFRCGKIKEAERALVGNIPNHKSQNQVPNGAYGHYLLGQILEKQLRIPEAKENYQQALELNPTLWTAFERLTKMGADVQGNKIFTESAYKKKCDTMKKSQNNIIITITNLIKKSVSKQNTSAQKEPIEMDDHENKREDVDQKQFKMSTSQVIQSLPSNLEEFQNKEKQVKTRGSQKNPQPINFQYYQNLLAQPFTFSQSSRAQPVRKSQGDMQKVGVSSMQSQPAFVAQITQAQTNISYLLRNLALPYQLWVYQSNDTIAAFQKLPANHYRSGWVLERVARCLMDQVKYAEAEKVWKELREIEPNRLEGMDYYSSCLWNLKKQTDLTYLAHQCLQTSKLAPETWIALGNCFSLNKENENLLKCFNRAIQLKPDNAYAHTLCGHEYVQIEEFRKAKQCYDQALTLDSQQYNALWGLGNIFYKQEKYDEAIKYFKKAIEVNKRNSVIFCFLGMAHAAKNQHQEALQCYQQSELIDPKNGMNRFEKANSLVKLGQYEMAIQELKTLEMMLPKEPQIFILMGKIYKKLNRINDSYKCFSLAQSLETKEQQRIKGMLDALNNQDNEFNDDFDL